MKLKVKYLRGGGADEWTSEESIVLRRWDWTALGLACLISLAALIAWRTAPVSLNTPAPGGFILWFLLCCAYPMLGFAGIIGCVAGEDFVRAFYSLAEARPVLALWGLDLFTVLVVWGIGRLCALRRQAVPTIRIAGHFLLIVIGWGVFQMMLFGIAQVRSSYQKAAPAVEQK